MCGRFYLDVSREQLKEHYQVPEIPEDLIPRFNIAPSQDILAIRAIPDHARTLSRLHWGLIPSWAKEEKTHYAMINAHAETVAEKPAFRAAFKHRRCLIPVSGFYEWQPQQGYKQPYAITLKMAGSSAWPASGNTGTAPRGKLSSPAPSL
jgi:putative SOS response-associated peptidase YedK